MSTETINGKRLKNMMIYAVYQLNKNRDELDSLNIFPVPDGDTGTNMSLTSLAAAKELQKISDSASCDLVMRAIANGSLRGARGNSGVILSQLFRGLSKGFKDKEEINTADFALAFQQSSEVAYKAVMKPKEGTVLTIAKALSEKSAELTPEVTDFDEFFPQLISHAKEVLAQTTFMLPALRAAGVVDAGGKGLVYIIEGMFEGLHQDAPRELEAETVGDTGGTKKESVFSSIATEDIKFAYCTEFFIEKQNYPENKMNRLTAYLETMGDSIVAVSGEDIIKIHVHTNHPGMVLERALQIAPLSSIKIENMHIQHTSIVNGAEAPASPPEKKPEAFMPKSDKTHQEFGVIGVSVGDGINDILTDLGCDYIISGGQSMNPSAEDFVQAAKTVKKSRFIFLPNNKNIIMAAKQAADILKKENAVEVLVLETKSIPQGIGAMIAMVRDKSFEDTFELMKQGAQAIRTGLVTEAVKDTEVDGKTIKTGDYLGLIEGKIEAVSSDSLGAAKLVIDHFAEECELISIFYGDKSAEGEGSELCSYVEGLGLEGELQYGGQPVYAYVISAE